MNRGASVFLRVVLVLFGIGALALLLWEPHLEGRNANATVFEIYFKDPFLAYVYFASIAFFAGLFQAFKVLGYAGRNQEFSPAAVRSVRTMKYCAIALVGFVAIAEAIIMFGNSDEDRAGGVVIGLVIFFAAIVVATATVLLERALQNGVDLKSENDLTV